ncbi:DUF1016 N-terminal domain-containing protein [Solitalea lacus]|uniref:DUF1016 N-terminal domain-containing protein n=1 Tax=Solitalea lacus TaxID=2911172 RepID=UPI003B84ABDC
MTFLYWIRVKDINERLFYIRKTIENGWSRNVMVLQIESNLYKHQGNAITNFASTLPALQSDLATETLKILFSHSGNGNGCITNF